MAPASSLTALLHSPAASSNDSTILANGKTLPDITLGSLGSSFRSDDQEGQPIDNVKGGRGGLSRGGSDLSRTPIVLHGALCRSRYQR